ncbi:Zinc-finger domain of monoamine-oxidase A repressor R1 [Arabidopsis suecica]|uniref:Zinc-finger domain of monoamine-oxidase A repressor R1 n=1 Tax=Arabidopsis suecica TaxID=45249 RepID=A0A8T2G3L6_ARASU|nr:Zinc-finger domain of monoamine-oxidase A repressor R1 [Arabidopsis suecica]
MLTMRTEAQDSVPKSNPNPELINETPKVSLYEQCREERIKENLQRMNNLGLLNLSRKLKPQTRPVKRSYGNRNSVQNPTPPLQPSRRSSRLENTTPVIYTDGINEKGKKASKRESVVIGEGIRAEIYTEEHEKLLGNTERSWTCFVDGYDKNGKRIYDPFNGKTCHQCRQKTMGHRTQCSECNLVQGQFCGDCLFMRYGEHVLEALENPDWICPACRGICNCSLCRNNKGWVPTGPIYRRIAALGYKSVAHYLIQTKRAPTDDTTPSQASAKRSLSFQEKIAGDEDVPMLENDDSLQKEEGENTNEDQNGDLPEEVQKVQNMECQSGGSLKKEEDETPNSARRSLSFLLPSVEDDQTSLVDVQVLSCLVPPKQEHSCAHNGDDLPDIQERIGQHSNLETKPDSYLLHVDEQIPLVDVQVLSYLETPKQEHSCAHIGDGLPKIQEWIGQDPTSETKPVSYLIPIDDDQTSLVDAQVMYLETPKQDKQEHSCAHIGDDLPEIQQGTGQDSNLETRLGESQTLVVKARVTRSKRKAALEPNPDSIGGRLRLRRRT